MKKIFMLSKFLAAALVITTISCKKEAAKNALTSPESVVQKSVDSNFVSMSVASNVAVQSTTFKTETNKKSVNSLLPVQDKQILDSLALPDPENPTCYIFNYVGGGWTMVAADKRIMPILAYSDKGHFATPEQNTTGLNDWQSVNNKNMQLLRKDPKIKAPAKVTLLWNKLARKDTPKAKQKVNNEPLPGPCVESVTQYTVGPLLVTSWDQGWPYNELCPAGLYDHSHKPTGCVATAMAQVMYYWHYPTSYAWSSMPTSWSGGTPSNSYVAQLMRDAGISVNMDYNDSGSFPHQSGLLLYSISAGTALYNVFGYTSVSGADYNYLTVMSNLDYGMPVLLKGDGANEGHEWVCDGYTTWTYGYCDPVSGNSSTYLHMNWGWGTYYSNANGNYNCDIWTVTAGSQTFYYPYNHKMFYNIHP